MHAKTWNKNQNLSQIYWRISSNLGKMKSTSSCNGFEFGFKWKITLTNLDWPGTKDTPSIISALLKIVLLTIGSQNYRTYKPHARF